MKFKAERLFIKVTTAFIIAAESCWKNTMDLQNVCLYVLKVSWKYDRCLSTKKIQNDSKSMTYYILHIRAHVKIKHYFPPY